MDLKELLVSNVNISEDEYIYKGVFTLSGSGKSAVIDLADMDTQAKLEEIKNYFSLKDNTESIRKEIMSQVFEKAAMSSNIKEGEAYQEGDNEDILDKSAKSLDRA